MSTATTFIATLLVGFRIGKIIVLWHKQNFRRDVQELRYT